MLEQLAIRFGLTEEHLAIRVPSGQQPLFKNRVAWAVSYVKNAGLLQYVRRGVYQITEAGRAVLQEGSTVINLAYLKKFDATKFGNPTLLSRRKKKKR